jgi:hypothetical protein
MSHGGAIPWAEGSGEETTTKHMKMHDDLTAEISRIIHLVHTLKVVATRTPRTARDDDSPLMPASCDACGGPARGLAYFLPFCVVEGWIRFGGWGGRMTCGLYSICRVQFQGSVGSSYRIMKSSIVTKG